MEWPSPEWSTEWGTESSPWGTSDAADTIAHHRALASTRTWQETKTASDWTESSPADTREDADKTVEHGWSSSNWTPAGSTTVEETNTTSLEELGWRSRDWTPAGPTTVEHWHEMNMQMQVMTQHMQEMKSEISFLRATIADLDAKLKGHSTGQNSRGSGLSTPESLFQAPTSSQLLPTMQAGACPQGWHGPGSGAVAYRGEAEISSIEAPEWEPYFSHLWTKFPQEIVFITELCEVLELQMKQQNITLYTCRSKSNASITVICNHCQNNATLGYGTNFRNSRRLAQYTLVKQEMAAFLRFKYKPEEERV